MPFDPFEGYLGLMLIVDRPWGTTQRDFARHLCPLCRSARGTYSRELCVGLETPYSSIVVLDAGIWHYPNAVCGLMTT